MNSRLKVGLDRFVEESRDYLGQWTFDAPFVIGSQSGWRHERLHEVMHKIVCEFVGNYKEYRQLMPVSEKVEKILEVFSEEPYSPGTFRTDYVFDSKGQAKLIEITCRFALNGVFESWFYQKLAYEFAEKFCPDLAVTHRLEAMYEHLDSLYSGFSEVLVLQGSDRSNSSRRFMKIFEDSGVKTSHLHWSELASNFQRLSNAFIVSELTLDEIESLPLSVHQHLSQCRLINDFRTVFLLHDKRFFSVLTNPRLQRACLSDEDRLFLEDFLIPTYVLGRDSSLTHEALNHQENWVLKHRALGKSEKIHAGIATPKDEWERLLQQVTFEDYVLQRWVPQRVWEGTVKGRRHEDYVTGTFMFFDGHFFGQGPIRTSGHPVKTRTNNRSVGVIELKDADAMWCADALGVVE